MISRVADFCFWFGRYLDRAESSARLMQTTRSLVFDADIPVTQCWKPLVIVSGAEQAFVERHGVEAMGDGNIVQRYMTWDRDNSVSLITSVRAARECARQIRDVLSLECWEETNELYLWLERASTEQLYELDRDEFFRHVRRGTQLCLGIVRSTMLHEEPMRFLWLGAMLERVNQTARILDMHHHTMELEEEAHDVVQVALWLSLLRACSGYEAFMKKNHGRVTAQAVASFLLFEPTFPRSLRYCLRSARSILLQIWPENPSQWHAPAHTKQLCTWLDERAAERLPRSIHALLTHVVDESSAICNEVSEEIHGPPRPIAQAQSQSHA